MTAIAIIPARGGSKRIPDKNIRAFEGKPIIAYSIQAALECQHIDHAVVSTDSPAIRDIALEYGAEVPFMRPAELSDDHTGTLPVVAHAIREYEKHQSFDEVCCLYATAPFITPSLLNLGFEKLQSENTSYAFSVTTYAFPVQRALRLLETGVAPLFPEHEQTRSQDLEEVVHDAGQFYWGKKAAFLGELPVYAKHSTPVILPRHRVQDIDTAEDWKRAELMYRLLLQSGELQ